MDGSGSIAVKVNDRRAEDGVVEMRITNIGIDCKMLNITLASAAAAAAQRKATDYPCKQLFISTTITCTLGKYSNF